MLGSAFALLACDRSPDPAVKPADATTPGSPGSPASPPAPPTTPPSADAPAPPAPEPWRYQPALAAATPAGTHAEPVLELADGLRGHARIVVAVATDRSPVRLEVWDFSQNNPRGLLAPDGDPQVLLDLGDVRGLLAVDAVAALRRDLATPGRERVRPLGLPGEPEDVLAELARLAVATTAAPDGATRARSLALFMRGVDDALLWQRLPELLRRLQSAPWQPGARTPLGARRLKISATEDGRPVQLELTRADDRWILSAVDDPAAEPATPAGP